MKKLFLGSVALVAVSLGTSAAFAAERPVPRPVPAYAPPPPAYTWNGCYVGASAGTSSGSSQHFDVAGNAITNSFDLSGFIGGGQLGCNWQWGAWVFGIEGDGSAINKSGQGFELQPIPRPNTLWISETQERWFVTARGRLGLTNFWWFGDRTLVYVTGGGAWAKIDASEWLTANAAGTGPIVTGHQESNTRSGYTVGGGIEYALGYGWSVKSEFLYADFGTFRTFTNPPFGANDIFPRDVKLKDYIWRAGMNYKFW
jgi:outer membrane immunogenic protein